MSTNSNLGWKYFVDVVPPTEEVFFSGWSSCKSNGMTRLNESLVSLRRESMRIESREPTVMITGDVGTFKLELAKKIHGFSRFAKEPFFNFSSDVLRQPYFLGSTGSDFVHKGTVFFNEIDKMPGDVQNWLLGFLKSPNSVQFRIISAANLKIQEMVGLGTFNGELYKLLSQSTIEIPQMSARGEDIITLATETAKFIYSKAGKTFGGFSTDALDLIRRHKWSGNDEEMDLVIRRTLGYTRSDQPVTAQVLAGISTGNTGVGTGINGQPGNGLSLVTNPYQSPGESGVDSYMRLKKKWVEGFEKEYLASTLARNGGNVSAAAREAKIDRSNFLRLLRRYGIKSMEFRKAA